LSTEILVVGADWLVGWCQIAAILSGADNIAPCWHRRHVDK